MDWIESLLNKRAKIRLGQDALMLDDLQKVAQFNRQSVAAAQQSFLGGQMPQPEKTDGEEMGVQVGDNITHNYPSPPSSKGLSPLATAAIGLGVAAVGGPLAALAWNAFMSRPPVPAPAPVVAPSTDNDTQYEIRLLP